MEKQKLEEVISFLSVKVYYYTFRQLYFKSTTYQLVGGFFITASLMYVLKFSLFFNVDVSRGCTFGALEGYRFQNN